MKKFLCLFSIIAIFSSLCLVSCDTECTSSTSSQSEGGDGGTPSVSVATLDVTINVIKDVTMDQIYQLQLNFNTGDKGDFPGTWDFTKKVAIGDGKGEMKITKNSDKTGVIKFTLEDNDLVDDFTPYYMVTLVNNKKTKLGNLEEIYQDDICFKKTTKHEITLTIDGMYADQGVVLQ